MYEKKALNNWKLVRLGDYVKYAKGKKPKKLSNVKNESFPVPYVNIKAFSTGLVDEYTDGKGCVLCEDGDFLMVWDGSRSGFVGKGIKGALGSTLVKLNFPDIENDYAYYFLQSKYFEINTKARGVGIPHVDPNILWNYTLPIPPRQIQNAIVSKIEELFSELDKGIEQLKTAREKLKVFKQTVLQWAFEGKLTAEWRSKQVDILKCEQIVNQLAQEKSQRLSATMSKPKLIPKIDDNELENLPKLPKEFSWIRLGELLWSVKDGPHYSPKYETSGIPFISGGNVKPNGIDFKNVKYISDALNEELSKRCKPEKGDVLYTKGGTTGIARVNTYDLDFNVWVHVAVLKLLNSVNPFYLQYALNSSHCYRQSQKYTHGVGNQDLGLTRMILITLPICSYEEQCQIVLEIESRFSVAEKIEESITQSLQQSESLRQSILKMAFEGRLTEASTLESVEVPIKEMPPERKVLAARIIHMFEQDRHFGLTKFQKVFFLAEHHAQVPYDTNYIKETAGPYDRIFTRAFREEMQQQDWVREEQRGKITRLQPGNNIGILEKEYAKHFRGKGKQITFVLTQLMSKSTHEAELIATLYAVWNNRLIQKKAMKVDKLVEDFFNWSPKKIEEFQEEEIISAFKWMKEIGLVPVGYGKLIDSVDN